MEGSIIIAIILSSSTALTGLITALFHSLSLSRCSHIICCFGCFDCNREVLSENAYIQENNNNNNNNNI
jgi:hypothetical protein